MKVCAVLVNYHGARDITQAVQSILADRQNIDIVVVDNSDDALEWEQLRRLLPPSVCKVRAPGNIGFGRGCNLALEHTDAPFVFLVNPDVRLLPGCTEALLDALLTDLTLGAVSPRQFLDEACHWQLPSSWLPTALRAWATERAMREPSVAVRLRKAKDAENRRFWRATQPIHQRALSGGAMMIRRSAIRPDESMFDPQYFMYFEDTDLCMRLRRRGLGLAMVPAARAVHAWRNQPHKVALMSRGSQVYFDKFYPSDDPWLSKCRAMANAPHRAPYAFQKFPPFGIPRPSHWTEGWILELSPSPLVEPSVSMTGRDAHINEPVNALAHFESFPVFGRLHSNSASDDLDESYFFHWNVGPDQ